MCDKLCAFLIVLSLQMRIGTSIDFVSETFENINHFQQYLKISENPNIVLLLGLTGTGKSTLVHYAAGNYSKIIAAEPKPPHINVRIDDMLEVNYGKISISTSLSRTIVPEMVIDEYQNVWYDCPGFGDTRGPMMELITTYLIKSVIENVSNMKIVLVLNYDDISGMGHRDILNKTLKRTVTLLNNVQLFGDSVAVVVTKAPSDYKLGKRTFDTHENTVKNLTADSMKALREVLSEERETESNKIALIDAILTQSDDGDFPKISVFWQPSDVGPLNTIDKMVDGRRKIRKSILENTNFANIEQNDFGFPLTAETRNFIDDLKQHTIRNISTILKNIDNDLLNMLRMELKSIDGPFKKQKWFSLIDKSFLDPNAPEPTLSRWIDDIKRLIDTFNITKMNMRKFDQIEQHVDNCNVLKVISESKTELPIRDFIAESSKTKDFLRKENDWHSFILQVYEFFSRYEVQKDVTIYNVKDLADWALPNKAQGLSIGTDNFDAFVNKFRKNTQFDSNASRLKQLNEIVEETLKYPPRYECGNDRTMTIKGNYVKSSDINPKIKCASSEITKINVYVVATFYIDSDLNLNGFAELNIFAHKWRILQKTTFYLNGLNGEQYGQLLILNINRSSKKSNEIGKPGQPGRDGGKFLGVAHEIIDADKLTVQQNGGNGGRGQVAYKDIYDSSHGGDLICGSPPARAAPGGIGGYFRLLTANESNSNLPRTETKIGLIGGYIIDNEKNFTSEGILYAVHCARVLDPQNYSHEVPEQRHPSINLSSSAIAYKAFLSEKLESPSLLEKIHETWNLLDNDANVNGAYTMDDFLRETNILDEQFYKLHTTANLLPFYDGLLKRFSDYRRLIRANVTKLDKKMLDLLHMTIVSKTISMRNIHESDLITRIENYLKSLVQKMKDYNDLFKNSNGMERLTSVKKLHDIYDCKIETKIDEAHAFIETDIRPTIIKLFEMLSQEMQGTLANTNHAKYLPKSVGERIANEETITKNIKQNVMKRMALGVANKVVEFLKFIPSFASAPMSMTGYSTNYVEAKQTEDLGLADVKKFQNLLSFDDQNIFEAIEKELNILIKSMKMTRNKNRILKEKLDEFSSRVNRMKSKAIYGHNDVRNLLKSLMSFVNGQVHEFVVAKGAVNRSLKNTANALALIASSVTHYDQLSNMTALRRNVGKAMNQDRESLIEIMAIDDRIYSRLMPMAKFLNENWNQRNFNSKSLATLNELKYQIPHDFRSIQKDIDALMTGFDNSEPKPEECLMEIKEAINLMLEIFHRIQKYQERREFIESVSNFFEHGHGTPTETNPQADDKMNQLQLNFKASIILEQYLRSIEGFKQCVFPFARDYVDAYRLPPTLSTNHIDSFISAVSEKVKTLTQNINDLNVTTFHEKIYIAYFDRPSMAANLPFYTWPITEVRSKIGRLFAGEKIYLLADIRKAAKRNAVKFDRIGIDFHLGDQRMDDNLKNVLKSFHVSLTHLGESNYRCDENIFTIYSRPFTLEFSFDKKEHGVPVVGSEAFNELSESLPVLSPYTLWAIQLKNGNYEQLQPFTDYIANVDLIGHGRYLGNGIDICSSNLDEYYTRKPF